MFEAFQVLRRYLCCSVVKWKSKQSYVYRFSGLTQRNQSSHTGECSPGAPVFMHSFPRTWCWVGLFSRVLAAKGGRYTMILLNCFKLLNPLWCILFLILCLIQFRLAFVLRTDTNTRDAINEMSKFALSVSLGGWKNTIYCSFHWKFESFAAVQKQVLLIQPACN